MQWLVLQPGNFSETHGAVYLPLGEHGIYTSAALGIAYYSCVAFILSAPAIFFLLGRRKR